MEGALDLSAKVTTETENPEENQHDNEQQKPGSPIATITESSPIATTGSPTIATSKEPSSTSATLRPFKMYPFDSLGGMYPQLASQASVLGNPGIYPYPSLPGLSPGLPSHMAGLLDPTLVAMSPFFQTAQRNENTRKRRIDSRSSSQESTENSHDTLSKISKSNTLEEGVSTTTDVEKIKNKNNENDATMIISKLNSITNVSTQSDINTHSALTASFPPSENTLNSPSTQPISDQNDTPLEYGYWDRRRKNNEAAKRSRDARRMKEEEIALRAAFLEQENLKLRAQVAVLKSETAKLHYMLYSR